MVALSEIEYSGPARPIDGYGPGFFRVAGQVFQGAIIATPTGVRPWGGMADNAALTALAGQVDVILLGTGTHLTYPDKALSAALDAVGIGLEPMSSPSAARSYNMLLAEGRRVAAALLPV